MEDKEIMHRKITTATRPTKPEEYRDHYYPKTEILGDDEMRITALGYAKTRMTVAAEDVWLRESADEAAERDEVMHFEGRGWNYDPDKMSEWLVEGQLHD